jgi:hypothetical protein
VAGRQACDGFQVRTRPGIVLLVLSLISSLSGAFAPSASASASAARAAVASCTTTLTCTAEQINAMSMPDRLTFLRSMSPGAAPGYPPRWGNIEGVLEFFIDRNLGKPGSWVSYVDAGDLEAVERGIALVEGRGTDTYGNPGSVLWASYLLILRNGQMGDRAAHDRAWSQAEQASIDDGVALAEKTHGLKPTPTEQRFLAFTQFYRWVLLNRPMLLDLGLPPIAPGKPLFQTNFLNWFTDVTDDVPSHKGAAFSYDVAQFNAPAGFTDFVQILVAYALYFMQG